ncbi:MAG: transcriptional repressor [Aquificae bacterium]|nr:transcriptional repressor [Aquificota bacterium]
MGPQRENKLTYPGGKMKFSNPVGEQIKENVQQKEALIKEIIEKLKKKGLKITAARVKVIEYLLQYGKHFEIETLVDWIRERCKGKQELEKVCPSRPTVYRTIKLLEELGYVKPIFKQNNRTIYELTPLGEEHYHLMCVKCGKLVEFENPRLGKEIRDIALSQGFRYLNHNLEVLGICPQCQEEEKEKQN